MRRNGICSKPSAESVFRRPRHSLRDCKTRENRHDLYIYMKIIKQLIHMSSEIKLIVITGLIVGTY